MAKVELRVHHRHVEGMSRRQAARLFGIDPKTVAKMLRFSVSPGYRRRKPPARPKLDPFVPVIDRVMEEDAAQPRKQRHTARRIFERLRAEHGFAGGETIVKDYVARSQQSCYEPPLRTSVQQDLENAILTRVQEALKTARNACSGQFRARPSRQGLAKSAVHRS